jgi:glycosyltransferase involved in cell wall biosynthesis
MQRMPHVTVAMPVFNAGEYLRPAVMSIVGQSFRDWELFVIDDGSSDNATDSIADIKDDRIVVVRDGKNKGLAARLNEVIDVARGKYFARMDQDDIAYPERFARQLAALDQDAALDLVATRCITIDPDNEIIGILPSALGHKEICARSWSGFYLPHPTWMGRIAWFRHHRYAKPGPYFCEDQELLLRSFEESRFGTIPEVLFAYRVRRRIGFIKSIRTRWTLLGLQMNKFLREGYWGRAALASAAFILGGCVDTVRAVLQCTSASSSFSRKKFSDEAEKIRWTKIKNAVLNGHAES